MHNERFGQQYHKENFSSQKMLLIIKRDFLSIYLINLNNLFFIDLIRKKFLRTETI